MSAETRMRTAECYTCLGGNFESRGDDFICCHWTAEVPAADGWWWWQAHPNYPKKPMEIWSKTRGSEVIERLCNYCGQTNLDALTKTYPAGRWAGPLPEPVDALDEEPTQNDGAQRADTAGGASCGAS